MLILVSVTISMAVNGGLFNYAGKAAKDTEEAKQDELDWLNLGNNLSTDQLIAKFTTDRKKDLANLRKYFVGNCIVDLYYENTNHFTDNDDLSDASSIIELDGTVDESTYKDYIIYHSYVYVLTINNEENVENVEALKDSESLAWIIFMDGDNLATVEYDDTEGIVTDCYKYNGKVYYIYTSDESGLPIDSEEAPKIELAIRVLENGEYLCNLETTESSLIVCYKCEGKMYKVTLNSNEFPIDIEEFDGIDVSFFDSEMGILLRKFNKFKRIRFSY